MKDEGPPMTLDVRRVQVWCADIPDRPGAAAAKIEAVYEVDQSPIGKTSRSIPATSW